MNELLLLLPQIISYSGKQTGRPISANKSVNHFTIFELEAFFGAASFFKKKLEYLKVRDEIIKIHGTWELKETSSAVFPKNSA